MKRICLLVLLCWPVSAFSDTPLTSSIELEREQNLSEAKARLAELEQVAKRLKGEIRRIQRSDLPDGKRTRVGGDQGKIVNGVRTSSYPSAGALIKGPDAASAKTQCTGTLIGSRTFLTAAHCVQPDPRPEQYHVYFQHGGVFAVTGITQHPEYDFPHADLAVLRLDRVASGIDPAPLNSAEVVSGTPGQIVGFGRAGGLQFDYGIKRVGSVTTAPCVRSETSLLCWDYTDPVGVAGLDSNTCNADSGGPLYLQPGGEDGELVLAGVTSGGSQSDCLSGDHSYDVDVRQFVPWITQVADGDLGLCGSNDLPLWGSDKVSSPSASTQLTLAEPMQVYTLPISDEVQHLRVALNGHDQANRDFDLRVNDGPDVSGSNHVCEQTGSGQYAFCEFSNPAAGNWSIEVSAKSGSGIAQLTATVFEKED